MMRPSILAVAAMLAPACESAGNDLQLAIAAPQAWCVIPGADASGRQMSCHLPFTKEGSDCTCKGPDGKTRAGKVKIVLPPPNKPLG